MKQLGYQLLFYWIKLGLYCYYRKIKVKGAANIPSDAPVLLLSNHQNALLDILIIATHGTRKPWYLTRADVFKNTQLKRFFTYLQMIPVYRIRDGKSQLTKNNAVFAFCGELLKKDQAILLFPEANHNLNKRVRPLSKGFTRIVDEALTNHLDKPLYIVPVGQNYVMPTHFVDACAIVYGAPIKVTRERFFKENGVVKLKEEVSDALKLLTTHIENEETHDATIAYLRKEKVDFLDPTAVNNKLKTINVAGLDKVTKETIKPTFSFAKLLLWLLNFPLLLSWRTFIVPKIPEPEFVDTFRFMFALLFYTLGYPIILAFLTFYLDVNTALVFVLLHVIANLFLVKSGMLQKK